MCASASARSVTGARLAFALPQWRPDSRSVAAYERSELLAQMAQHTIDANADVPGATAVVVKVTARAMEEGAAAPVADVVVCGAS